MKFKIKPLQFSNKMLSIYTESKTYYGRWVIGNSENLYDSLLFYTERQKLKFPCISNNIDFNTKEESIKYANRLHKIMIRNYLTLFDINNQIFKIKPLLLKKVSDNREITNTFYGFFSIDKDYYENIVVEFISISGVSYLKYFNTYCDAVAYINRLHRIMIRMYLTEV
jgi:hypothetical protein